MGTYLNPGCDGFERIIKGIYIDKTGLIELINKTIGTTDNLICVSRPRRFGKSYAAQMLAAYYDCTCDADNLFKGFDIAESDQYRAHLNKYNVIYLDITGFISDLKSEGESLKSVTNNIKDVIRKELMVLYPEIEECSKLSEAILKYVEKTGRKFVFIIDEWDAVIREAKNESDIQKAYLNFLRDLFKNGNFTPKAVAAAYMTGILPIKKDGTESAISDFNEYSFLSPGSFAEYTGFTEDEVRSLCEQNEMEIKGLKEWYDGYSFDKDCIIYNPYSVMSAIKKKSLGSYWQKTSAAESLTTYINMNYDGLQDVVLRLISGEEIEVDVDMFENDVESFKSKDDVLTLLIHLGYLTYDQVNKTARIPNKEVRSEFQSLLRTSGNSKLAELIANSERLLKDTIVDNEQAVEEAIERIRESEYAPAFYNDEQALRYILKFAYITCVEQYLKVEELPSGRGVADVVFVPKKTSPLPALVVELKWNKTAEAAIAQIEKNNYPKVLEDFCGCIKLVGINYDEKSKKHTCRIRTVNRHSQRESSPMTSKARRDL